MFINTQKSKQKNLTTITVYKKNKKKRRKESKSFKWIVYEQIEQTWDHVGALEHDHVRALAEHDQVRVAKESNHFERVLERHELVVLALDEEHTVLGHLVILLAARQPGLTLHCVEEHVRSHSECLARVLGQVTVGTKGRARTKR